MGLFNRKEKLYDPEKDNLPPVPPEEIGEPQRLAELIWNFENHGITTWADVRRMHEEGYSVSTQMYKDRIALANHILGRYEPREATRAETTP